VFALFERKKCDGRFRPAKSAVEIERMDIIVIDGDEQFMDSLCVCALPQLGQELPSNAFSLLLASHGNIVNEEFGFRSRQRQGVSGQSAYDLISGKCRDRPKIFSGK